jgi:plastocyanin
MSLKRSLLVLACVALLGAACGEESTGAPDGGSGATAIEVSAAEFAFNPTTIDASAGEEIELTFNNTGTTEHSFTIDGLVEVEAEGGAQASGTFTAPDSPIEFFCKYHPDQMRGELTIDGQSAGGGGGDTGGGTDDNLDY